MRHRLCWIVLFQHARLIGSFESITYTKEADMIMRYSGLVAQVRLVRAHNDTHNPNPTNNTQIWAMPRDISMHETVLAGDINSYAVLPLLPPTLPFFFLGKAQVFLDKVL